MSLDPESDFVRAAIAALKVDARVTALCGGRVYDRVPQKVAGERGVQMPYVSIGPISSADDSADCIDGVEMSVQFDVWARADADANVATTCRALCEAIRRVLHDAELVLADNRLASVAFERKSIFDDPDGITRHGVVQFLAVVETA